MRFSIATFVLVGVALSAPVQDIDTKDRAAKAVENDRLVTRGLAPVALFPRLGPVLAPKPGPKPGAPPNTPKTPPRPGQGAPNDQGPPPPLRPGDDSPSPNTPKDGPDGTAPKDGPDIVRGPENDLDSPVPVCKAGKKRAICLNEDLNTPMTKEELDAFEAAGKKNIRPLQDRIEGRVTNDKAKVGDGTLNNLPGYNVEVKPNIKPDGKPIHDLESQQYLQDPKYGGAFKNADFEEITLLPDAAQKQKVQTWSQGKDIDNALNNNPAWKDVDPEYKAMFKQGAVASQLDTPMLKILVNPGKGSAVVQKVFKDNDPHQPGKVTVDGEALGLPKVDVERPAFDRQNAVFASDQIMGALRQGVERYNSRLKPGQTPAKMEDYKYIAMDEMITPDTKKLSNHVIGKENTDLPPRVGEVQKTTIAPSHQDHNKLTATVQNSPLVRMAAQYHTELGKPTLPPYDVSRTRIKENGNDPNDVLRFDGVVTVLERQ